VKPEISNSLAFNDSLKARGMNPYKSYSKFPSGSFSSRNPSRIEIKRTPISNSFRIIYFKIFEFHLQNVNQLPIRRYSSLKILSSMVKPLSMAIEQHQQPA